jgi:hypothetical protein
MIRKEEKEKQPDRQKLKIDEPADESESTKKETKR